jgi:hypothetical protein
LISPQLTRELYNIDPNITAGLDNSYFLPKLTEAEYTRKLNEIETAKSNIGTGLSNAEADSHGVETNLTTGIPTKVEQDPTTNILMEDVQKIAEDYRIRNNQGDVTPEEATIIATVIKNR